MVPTEHEPKLLLTLDTHWHTAVRNPRWRTSSHLELLHIHLNLRQSHASHPHHRYYSVNSLQNLFTIDAKSDKCQTECLLAYLLMVEQRISNVVQADYIFVYTAPFWLKTCPRLLRIFVPVGIKPMTYWSQVQCMYNNIASTSLVSDIMVVPEVL